MNPNRVDIPHVAEVLISMCRKVGPKTMRRVLHGQDGDRMFIPGERLHDRRLIALAVEGEEVDRAWAAVLPQEAIKGHHPYRRRSGAICFR